MILILILNWLILKETLVIGRINTQRTKVCGQKESRLCVSTKREVEQRMEEIVKVHALQGTSCEQKLEGDLYI